MFSLFDICGTGFDRITFAVYDDGPGWVVLESSIGVTCLKGSGELKRHLISMIPMSVEYKLFGMGASELVIKYKYRLINRLIDYICTNTRLLEIPQ